MELVRPWLAALFAVLMFGPYLSTSWDIAQDKDVLPRAPERMTVAAAASLSLDRVAWVSLDDAVFKTKRAVPRKKMKSVCVPITDATGQPLILGMKTKADAPPVGLLERARIHELRELESKGFFGPSGAPRGPVYVLSCGQGPEQLTKRERLGRGFVGFLFLGWAVLWGIRRAARPVEPVSSTDIRWACLAPLLFGSAVLLITPIDGPAPPVMKGVAVVFLVLGSTFLLLGGTRPVLRAVNWLDGAR